MSLSLGIGLGLTHGSKGFSLLDLFAAGEVGAWLDPSDLTTLWQDTLKTVPVTSDGDSVKVMEDKSGNGFHFATTLDANRPTYKTSGGKHWLLFDGVSDNLGYNYVPGGLLNGGGCMAAAFRATSDLTVGGVMDEWLITDSNWHSVLFSDTRNTSFRHSNYAPDGTPRFISHSTKQDTSNYVSIFNSDGTDGVGYSGNTSLGSVSTTADTLTDTVLTVGRQTIGDLYFSGRFYGGIFRDTHLTVNERTELNSFLTGKM